MPSLARRLDWLAPKLSCEAWRESIRSEMDEAVRLLRLLREPDEREDRRLNADDADVALASSSALPDRMDSNESRSDVMVDGAPMEGSSASSRWALPPPSARS